MPNEVWLCADFNDMENFGLLCKARLLASKCGRQVAVVIFNSSSDDSLLIHKGADIVYNLCAEGSNIVKSQALFDLCNEYHPDILLFPATVEYSAIAARTAAKLSTGLTADCTSLEVDKNGLLKQTRPAFGGGLIADIYCYNRRPQMATVRPGVFPVSNPDLRRKGTHISFKLTSMHADPVKILSIERISSKKDLREGNIIVAGGKGIGSREGFGLLESLADRIGGLLGASRSAVDAGYADYDRQIGQTGLSVSPNLYIAFAISGAPQHIAGMNTSSKVIAINSDPEAPIFDYADLAIVGDWFETVNAILKTIKDKT